MKIIKRDGRIVDYDRQKIAVAIEKANRDVIGKEKATKEEIILIFYLFSNFFDIFMFLLYINFIHFLLHLSQFL